MRIILNTPLKIDVSEIAAFFPDFVHRKPFMGTFGFVDSELIRNDRSRDKLVLMLFDVRSIQGFREICSDYDNLDGLKQILSILPGSLRKKLFSAFDDAEILLRPYEIADRPWREYFERMPSAKKLEQRLNPKLETYQGKMTSTANTDVVNKVIHLDISQPSLKVVLSYVYELKNLENAARYQQLIQDARNNKIYKARFIYEIFKLEAEAVYFRSLSFRELKLPNHLFPNRKDYLTLYDEIRDLSFAEAIAFVARFIQDTGIVKREHAAKRYYADFFEVLSGARESLASYNIFSQQPTIILPDRMSNEHDPHVSELASHRF